VVQKYSLLCFLCLFVAIYPAFAQQTFDEWLAQDQAAFAQYQAEVTAQYERFLKEEAEAYNVFLREAGKQWGEQNVWMPEQKRWVQYTEALDERSAVHFEDGVAEVEIIIGPGTSDAEARTLVAAGVENLVLSGTVDPIEMIRRRLFPKSVRETNDPDPGKTLPSARKRVTLTPAKAEVPTAGPQVPLEKRQGDAAAVAKPATPSGAAGHYTVQGGDTLWGLSKRFGVSRQLIAEANGISADGWLKVGQKLVIPGQAPVPLTVASRLEGEAAGRPEPLRSREPSRHTPAAAAPATAQKPPLLDRQVAMPDGTPVTRENARAFAETQAASANVKRQTVTGSDNVQREVVRVSFPLAPDHLRVRAERFQPFVTRYAAQYGVYPPLIYAIIHSESSFNPRARSHVPAYGLMQLVPRSGARDAYLLVYKQDRMLSDTYLYDPERNIELGAAYLHILQDRYFKQVENPMNRMLCAIAGYNTGAGNVCKAFDAGTSLSRAAPVINGMTPDQVYSRLRTTLPYEETRNYIVKVNERLPLYREWQ
jgi:soluble lytic murein transglycosylase-like protein